MNGDDSKLTAVKKIREALFVDRSLSNKASGLYATSKGTKKGGCFSR
jgi:hypothetical protein